MTEDVEQDIEKKVEQKKKIESSALSNIPPIAIITIIGVILIAFFFGNLTTNQWIVLILIITFILWVLSIRMVGVGHPLTEEEAKALLNIKLKNKTKIGEIHPNYRIIVGLVSALPFIDGKQREYFIPFNLINEDNVPIAYLARMDRFTGNTTYAKYPEGFLGTEKPNIRHVLPEDYNVMKRMGVEKSVWSKLIFGR